MIVVGTVALKVDNAGGGVRCEENRRAHLVRMRKVEGSDYVVFNCPACDRRNKKSVYRQKYETPDGKLGFMCSGCERTVEVSAPFEPRALMVSA